MAKRLHGGDYTLDPLFMERINTSLAEQAEAHFLKPGQGIIEIGDSEEKSITKERDTEESTSHTSSNLFLSSPLHTCEESQVINLLDINNPHLTTNMTTNMSTNNEGLVVEREGRRGVTFHDGIKHVLLTNGIIKNTNQQCQSVNDIICQICLEPFSTQHDLIVICDICNLHVHQLCYGSDLLPNIPEGPWYCNRCSFCLKSHADPLSIKCLLCPSQKGALRHLGPATWVHSVCVNWIPEVFFEGVKLDKVDLKKILKWRFLHQCTYCHQKKGAILMCDYKDCNKKFHITCAIENGAIVDWESMSKLKRVNDSEDFVPLYCLEHFNSAQANLTAYKYSAITTMALEPKNPTTPKPEKKKNKRLESSMRKPRNKREEHKTPKKSNLKKKRTFSIMSKPKPRVRIKEEPFLQSSDSESEKYAPFLQKKYSQQKISDFMNTPKAERTPSRKKSIIKQEEESKASNNENIRSIENNITTGDWHLNVTFKEGTDYNEKLKFILQTINERRQNFSLSINFHS